MTKSWIVLAAAALVALSGCQGGKRVFGTTAGGEEVSEFTLENSNGVKAVLIDYGATLTQLHLPDRDGTVEDCVLGFDDVAGYQGTTNQYFGCTTGRVCNRIAGGKFSLDGEDHQLATNNGDHHLHGGEVGFDKRMWEASRSGNSVTFTRVSPDGEENYPGALDLEVVYTLTDDDVLRIEYSASCDAATPVNLTHHSYFNLAGHDDGDILDHHLHLDCAQYTLPGADPLIPSGEIGPVAGTAFDFHSDGGKVIGDDIGQVEGGYDLNFVVDRAAGDRSLARAATLHDPDSGRRMEIWTDQPGIQFYTGNFLDGARGKGGAVYPKNGACCLETQHYPDSPNKPSFPSVVLRPGETYRHVIEHRFSAE